LNRLADAVADFVASKGVRTGERVGLLGQNSAGFVVVLMGIMRAGAVAVPINFKFSDETIEFVRKDAELVMAFVDDDQASRLGGLPSVPLDLDRIAGLSGEDEQGQAADRTGRAPGADAPALVLYTSGSTGRPKGVLLSHESQWSMIEVLSKRLTGLTGIVAAPLYHMNGMLFSFMLLVARGTLVLMPRFDAAAYLRAVHTYRVNLVSGVPTMLSLLAREPEISKGLDLGCVLSVQVGSAPLSETVVKQALDLFPNARISNGYGTTEAGAGMFGAHPEGLRVPTMSLGYPADHVQVRLSVGSRTASAHDAAEAEGVLEVKTPSAMTAYLNEPAKTADKMSDEGWINTGDIMRRDESGFYYFVGRDDDMFVCSGENIFPGEVERLLERDSRIAEACVVPCADELRGQIPIAFVVTSLDGQVSEQDVKDIALAGAPPYMHPRRVHFLEEMPLAGTNKIDRKALAIRASEHER
jgi:acyl-CoA synthetase (AMP-forming)/AMP-acid ligase II